MNVLLRFVARRRLMAALVMLCVMVGAVSWGVMPRQEDPSFVNRTASVVVPWPGADALRVEALVVRPLEDALAEVPEIRKVVAAARGGVAVFTLQLADDVYTTETVWDDVREALQTGSAELPDGAGPVHLNNKVGDPASMVLMVTGSDDLLVLRRAADLARDRFLRVPGVARVEVLGDPGEQLSVRMDPDEAQRLGLDARSLAALLASRNAVIPGGSVVVDGRSAVLRPRAELADVAAFRDTPILFPGGAAIPLGELATVDLEPATPPTERLRHEGAPAVGIAITPVLPQDLAGLGERLNAATAALAEDLAPLQIEVFSSQPAKVVARLGDLTRSLVLAMLVVAGVLLLAMGPRLGLVVASIVPLVALSTMAVYAAGGGVLHQISVAALVLSLGLLVDNAIVVAETVQRNLDEGLEPGAAASETLRELAIPLGTATGTTVAAFVPMLLSTGGTAHFTRSVPLVVVTALVLSYAFALAVTPAMAGRLLVRRGDRAQGRLSLLAERLGRAVVARPLRALGGVAIALLLAAAMLPGVTQQFFPLSDRPRVLISVELPEGAHLSRTESTVASLEAALADPGVSMTSFIGRGPPRFYYNLNNVPRSPHAATIVATVSHADEVGPFVDAVRVAARALPQATIVPKRLQQGPPVGAPVELRITGEDLEALRIATDSAVRILRDVPGTRDVRHDLGVGVPTLAWDIDDAGAARHGLSRGDVALALLAQTHGLSAGQLRRADEPVDVVVGSLSGERTRTESLLTTQVSAPGRPGVPLPALAEATLGWVPAAVHREGRTRVVTVQAELAEGTTFSQVVARATPRLPAMEQEGVRHSWGGEAEGSAEANGALLRAVPVGLGMLLFFLLLEFDSVRRVGIVLVTVPLAAVGVIPGLALSGQPFGFMSLMGVIALIGIVVNNAIVLIEVIDTERRGGATVGEAVVRGVERRMRPILLTTGTTVAGMLPLALSSSPLWPPLAWAMGSGLLASTGLTLVAVPALYTLLLGREGSRWRFGRGAGVVAMMLAFAPLAHGAEISLSEALEAGQEAPIPRADSARAAASRSDTAAAWLAAVGPEAGVQASAYRRDHALEITTPVGPFLQAPASLSSLGARVSVPVLDPGAMADAVAVGRGALAAGHDATRSRRLGALAAAEAWLDVRLIDAQRRANVAYVASLERLARDLQARVAVDLIVPADALRADVAVLDAQQVTTVLDGQRLVATQRLGAAVGIDGAAEPTGELPGIPPSASGTREDVAAADAQLKALRAVRTAIWADALPTLEVYGSFTALDQDSLVEPTWLEGGATITWTALARGTRPARSAAASRRLAEVEARRRGLSLAVEVEQQAAQVAIGVAEAEVGIRGRAVEQALEARDIVVDRHAQGLATLTDVLQVEAELRAQRTGLDVARVQQVRAGLRAQVVAGADPVLPSSP